MCNSICLSILIKKFSDLLIFDSLKGKKYSINTIEEIIEEIDKITLEEQFETISANVEEDIDGNQINLTFNIEKSETLTVEKINILEII